MKDLLEKQHTDLSHLVDDLKARLFTLHFKNSTGQQDQTHKIKLIRRDIARVLMAISIKEEKEGKKQLVANTKKVKKSYSLKLKAKPAVEKKNDQIKVADIKETEVEEKVEVKKPKAKVEVKKTKAKVEDKKTEVEKGDK
jgi:large subunit ribosomal protein L29